MSCTKARPNLTCTFSVMFRTGRINLLYPRNRSRTNRSSSSEHQPGKNINHKYVIFCQRLISFGIMTISILRCNRVIGDKFCEFQTIIHACAFPFLDSVYENSSFHLFFAMLSCQIGKIFVQFGFGWIKLFCA